MSICMFQLHFPKSNFEFEYHFFFLLQYEKIAKNIRTLHHPASTLCQKRNQKKMITNNKITETLKSHRNIKMKSRVEWNGSRRITSNIKKLNP